MRRKAPDDYHALAEERDFRWLGPEVPTIHTKTTWMCEQGHQWEAIYSNIQRGKGCPFCYGNAPKIPDDYHALAEKRDFVWLGPEVPTNHTKTTWMCKQGHQWEAVYSNIQRGSGCPFCAGKAPKTPTDYHTLAEQRGFRWLGPEGPTTHTKTTWECEQGHQWEAVYNSIQRGRGCPFCYGKVPKTPDDYHILAEEHGFRWVGPEVPNTGTKTTWMCEQGHQWEAVYDSIKQGSSCPFCAGNAPKTPMDYHTLAEERGFRWIGPEVPNANAKTTWMCEQGHQWETVYNSIKQGTGCPFCAGIVPKTPKDYHALAEGHGFSWIGLEVSNARTKTTWMCEQGHQWEATYDNIQRESGCPFCAGLAPRTPKDYHALAEERGFRWIGPEVPNARTKTTWMCEQGHQWEAVYDSIQQGTGCPFCAGTVPKTPKDYHALAEEHGFRWVGPEVPNTGTKTTWMCEQGHQWEAVYGSIQRGTGCPTCVDMVEGARVSKIQRDLCEMLGGELNQPFRSFRIDITLEIDDAAIAVEYDSWYWHAGREEHDSQRDKAMIDAGWCVLRVKSNELLPTREQLDDAIARLLAGERQVEILLEDWGNGPTRFELD